MKVLREETKARNKFKNIKESKQVSPMKAINFYCRFCCPDLTEDLTGVACQKEDCPFGYIKKQMDAIRIENGKESILSLSKAKPNKRVGKDEKGGSKPLKTQLNGIPKDYDKEQPTENRSFWDCILGKRGTV